MTLASALPVVRVPELDAGRETRASTGCDPRARGGARRRRPRLRPSANPGGRHVRHRRSTQPIRPFQVEVPEEQLDDLRRRIAATRWPSKELVADRSQGVQLATMQALARYWATEYDWRSVRGEAERAAAVHDRDRRGRHPLHPRAVAARGRAAADHDPRLARLGHRAARHRRPAHRPDRSRRHAPRTRSTWCCRPCPATASRASRPSSAGSRPHRRRVGGADEPPRLHPLRRPGRRRGRRRHRRDGPPGAGGAARHPRQPARGGARRSATTCRRSPSRNARRTTALDDVHDGRLRLLPGAGHPAADDRLLAAGFTRRAGGLDARPRHGQLLQDLPRVRRRRARRATSPGSTSSTTSRCTG